MRVLLTVITAILFCIQAVAQEDARTSAIVKEGKALYRSEMASWYGTDVFLAKLKDQLDNVGGYFSYGDKDITHCVFFSRGDAPKVLATISFDSSYNVNTAKVDDRQREFSKTETDIYTIRQKALDEVNTDTLFKGYKHTKLNLIPLIDGGEKKVYVLTGPEVSGVVVFGNDYLLTFDKDNKLTGKKQLHKNIIPIEYGQEEKEGRKAVGAIHMHLPETGDYITSTDICTLMLYSKFAKWKQHLVVSENYVSIWNCENNQLVMLTRQAWDNINSDQKKKGKD